MKICNQCNLQYYDNKNFCKGCGSRLVLYQEISEKEEIINEGTNVLIQDNQYHFETTKQVSSQQEPLNDLFENQSDIVPLKTEMIHEFGQLTIDKKEKIGKVTRWKVKRIFIVLTALVIVLIIISTSIFIYFNSKDKSAFEQAKKENTLRSYQFYLDNYPKGKYSQKSLEIRDEIFWNIVATVNTPMSFDEYLSHYPSGKHSIEAKNKLEESNGYTIKFTYLNSNNGVKLSRIKILPDKVEVRLFISKGGTLYKPGDEKGFFIRDNMTGRRYNLTDASSFGNIRSNSFVVLYFEKIPYQIKTIDIIEGNAGASGWHINEIILKKEFLYESNFSVVRTSIDPKAESANYPNYLEKFIGVWSYDNQRYLIEISYINKKIRIRLCYELDASSGTEFFGNYSSGIITAIGNENDFYKFEFPKFQVLDNGDLLHECGACDPDHLKKTTIRMPNVKYYPPVNND